MRIQFCDSLIDRAKNLNLVFLTGDLGFMALENLATFMGPRFINAGISEQNMITISAAMAKDGFEVWAYSIAPFCYARPFEQIRNDITFHELRVRIVGNGGGYGYGVMGPTHHAIEDYGVLLTLPNIKVFIPAFDEDVIESVKRAGDFEYASYLRLGRGESPKSYKVPFYSPWRQLTFGEGAVIIVAGPLAGTYLSTLQDLPNNIRPNLWVTCELPIKLNPFPDELKIQLNNAEIVCVAEEHVERGGLGQEIAMQLLLLKILPRKFIHMHALSHIYDRYGSQKYLREKSKLDVQSLMNFIEIKK